jgi:hypothetical protein
MLGEGMDITLKRIDSMTDEEVNNAIEACFDEAPERGKLTRLAILLEAQFYRTERYQRVEDKAQAARDDVETQRWGIDLKNEKIIIVMIAIEIVLSLVAIGLAVSSDWHQSRDVERQLAESRAIETNLQNLEKSSDATAKTLVAVQGTMEGMNTTLQKQLMLFYDVSVNVIIDPTTKEIWLINNGRTSVVIWGTKFGEGAAYIAKTGRTVAPAASIRFSGMDIYNSLIARFPKPQVGFTPFEFYIKNEKQEQFIESGVIGIQWEGDNAKAFAQTNSVTPSHWNQASSPAPPTHS